MRGREEEKGPPAISYILGHCAGTNPAFLPKTGFIRENKGVRF